MQKEKKYYLKVRKWMKKHFLCFKTDVNTGLQDSRIDVVGVRDVGGSLSGEVETISIEVKRGTAPFATSCGQALGYKIYANRVYLADVRNDPFYDDEIKIASNLGLGLIQIKKTGKCKEILTSPYYTPMISHNLRLLQKLNLRKCQICENFVEMKHPSYDTIEDAIKKEKAFRFWNIEVAERKRKLGLIDIEKGYTREFRFVCLECLKTFFQDVEN